MKKTDQFYFEQIPSLFEFQKVEDIFGEKFFIKEQNSEKQKMTGVLQRYCLDDEYEISIFKIKGKTQQVLDNPPVSVEFFEMMYCLEGECNFSSNFEGKTKKYHLKKGDILLHKAHNGIKNYKVNCNNLKLITIDIYINEIISNNLKLKNIEKINQWKEKIFRIFRNDEFYFGKSSGEIDILAREIANTSINSIDSYLKFKMKVFKFIVLILEIQSSFTDDSLISKQAKELLEEFKISNLPTVKELCELMNTSRYHLEQAFKNYEKIGISEYIQKKKMKYAEMLLTSTNKNILEIANEIGYENPSKFSQSFKKYLGILPRQYRNMNSERNNE